jgi:nitrile hydratase subunit beta
MNGVHDMGGMHGFGPVRPEENEPVFHARWEARVFALRLMMGAWRRWNIDAGRHSIERQPPADYLRRTYYEKWLASLVDMSLDAGLLTAEEIASGRKAPSVATLAPPQTADKVAAELAAGSPSHRDVSATPRFTVGESVRASNINPTGHTRLPRYVRARVGVIERDHGAHVFPDSNAHFEGEGPQFLYTVRFAARDLWGPAAHAADAVFLDLWESYLDRA